MASKKLVNLKKKKSYNFPYIKILNELIESIQSINTINIKRQLIILNEQMFCVVIYSIICAFMLKIENNS